MVLKGSNLYRAPGDLLDHPCVPLYSDSDHIPDLKRSVCLQRDTGKEVSQCVLKRQTKDDAEYR